MLCLDQNHAVCGAHTVESEAGGVFQHFDRSDIVGIDSHEAAARSRLDWQSVNDEEWFRVAIDGCLSANPDGDSTFCILGDHYASDMTLQRPFNRLIGGLVEVFRL